MKTTLLKKEILTQKTNVFFDLNGFYNKLDENLLTPNPSNVFMRVNNQKMSEGQVMRGYKFMPMKYAFGLAAQLLTDNKEGLIFFEENEKLYHYIRIWIIDNCFHLYVFRFMPNFLLSSGFMAYSY